MSQVMQRNKLSSQCSTESNLLELNEHLVPTNFGYNCCAPPDDVEIATGQASFDDGDVHGEMSTWINSCGSPGMLGMLEDSDDVLADFDYRYFQPLKSPFSDTSATFINTLTQPESRSLCNSKGVGHREV